MQFPPALWLDGLTILFQVEMDTDKTGDENAAAEFSVSKFIRFILLFAMIFILLFEIDWLNCDISHFKM